jgi:hypothetical protein
MIDAVKDSVWVQLDIGVARDQHRRAAVQGACYIPGHVKNLIGTLRLTASEIPTQRISKFYRSGLTVLVGSH